MTAQTNIDKIASSTWLIAAGRLLIPTSALFLALLIWVALGIVTSTDSNTAAIQELKLDRANGATANAKTLADIQSSTAAALASTTLALAKVQAAVEMQTYRLDEIAKRLDNMEDIKNGSLVVPPPAHEQPL